ncbi:crossover junction endonuclease EME1 [Aricia agestis]|uniref:crossover junction endonuclease EME1 n=1 Tax=Aricia agestis TaxID=91739 RepID=UPI001C202D87|nr:crossover junction endonuclease EME1 [Aricia agestis]
MDYVATVDLSSDDNASANDNEDDFLPEINVVSTSSSQNGSQETYTSSTSGPSSQIAAKTKKQLLEERRRERALAKQNNKIYKPGECMKHMHIEMHPGLLATWYCADIPRELGAAGAHLKSSPALWDTSLVLWSRSVDPVLTNAGGMVGLSASQERCDRGLYVCTAEEVAPHVEAHTLASHMATVEDLAGCKLTLVMFGIKDYFKSSGRKTNNSSRKLMNEIDLEMAITDLLVSAQIDALLVNTPSELALTVLQFTKAIAEAPYKKAKRAFDEQADFYMKGDNKKCVAVDGDGNGVTRLWQQMLAVLPQSSLQTARSLARRYALPKALYEALQVPGGVEAVAGAGVTRAAGGGARALGPQFARKLHTLFTAEDGDLLID